MPMRFSAPLVVLSALVSLFLAGSVRADELGFPGEAFAKLDTFEAERAA